MVSPILNDVWTPLRAHPQQAALWRAKERFVAVLAGRGSGKTEIAKRRLVRYLPIRKPWPDPRYFYGAPTRHQAKRIAWEHLKKLIPNEWILGLPMESELRIETVFGSSLQVIGLDQPQRIEGVQWDGCVIDESSDIKPKTFDLSIAPTLIWRNGWCWRIGVPKRQGIGAAEFRRLCEFGESGEDTNTTTFSWPSADIVPEAVLLDARKRLDIKDYREQFEACWETSGGLIFHAFDNHMNVRPCEYVVGKPLVVGCDFNVDPMAWVIGHRYQDRLEIFDEIWLRNTNTAEALKVLATRYADHRGGIEFYGDASSQSRATSSHQTDYLQILNDPDIDRLRRAVHFPRSNPSRVDRFATCNALFCHADGDRRCFVAPNCKHLTADLGDRYYKPGTREAADAGDLGHMTDALGYIIHKLFPIRLTMPSTNRVVLRK